LQQKERKKNGKNPGKNGLVEVTTSCGLGTGDKLDFVGRTQYNTWISGSGASTMTIDLKKKKIKIDRYTVRQFNQNCCYPRGWNLEGSTNDKKYDVIQKYTDTTITMADQVADYKVKKCKKYYRFIRINHNVQNSSNWNWGLQMEFYGYLK